MSDDELPRSDEPYFLDEPQMFANARKAQAELRDMIGAGKEREAYWDEIFRRLVNCG